MIHRLSQGLNSIKERAEVIDKLRVLFSIGEAGRIGRKALALKLGVGEGYLRKLLDELESLGLISRDREGASLLDKGEALLGKARSALRVYRGVSVEGYTGSAVVVSGLEKHITNGLDERDEAVRFGARGAMVMVVKAGELWFPMVSNISREHPEFSQKIMSAFGLSDGDVMIFAWDGGPDSERAAIAAALLVLRKAGLDILAI